MSSHRFFPILSLLVAWSATSAAARAQSDSTSVDTARGALTGSTRRIGLGGAFVALADDSEGVAINPASVALRLPHSWDIWDYGFGVDFSIGAWLPKNDLYNQGGGEGQPKKSSALFGSLAAVLYAGHFGAGFSAEAQRNAASRADQAQGISRSFAANFGLVHTDVGYGFLDGQLLVGTGLRFVGMSFDRASGSSGLSSAGVGYEAGFVVKPQVAQYRIAASYKSPIDANTGDATVHVPWELALGFAYQFGPRFLNPRFVSATEVARRRKPEVEEPSKADLAAAKQELFEIYQRQQRWYLLVSTELALAEGDGERRGVERIWTSAGSVSTSRPVIVPRVGVESEVVPHVLRLRAGSYYEPERVSLSPARVHGTGGFDVRLFEWDVFGLIKPFDWWQLSVAADAAREYLNTSFSIGFWH